MATDNDLFGALKPPASTPKVSTGAMSALDKIIAAGSAFESVVDKPVVPKAKPPAAPVKPIELKDNEFLLSTMTNGKLPKSGKDHIFTMYAKDHWDAEHQVHIPAVDTYFVWDANVAEALWVAVTLGEVALLHGLPGTGKTSSVHQLAAWLRQPYAKFGGKGSIEPSAFLGSIHGTFKMVEENGVEKVVPVTEFKEGLLPLAIRGGYLCTIDEVMKLPPDVQMSLQALYEKGGSLTLDDKPGPLEDKIIKPPEEFKMFLTDNTLGTGDQMNMFAASQMQDTSTLDRIIITIPVDYMEPQVECKMLEAKFPKVAMDNIYKVVKFAGLVRESYRTANMPVTLSPRGLEGICGVLDVGLSLETALQLVFLNKLAEDEHKILAQEQLNTVR